MECWVCLLSSLWKGHLSKEGEKGHTGTEDERSQRAVLSLAPGVWCHLPNDLFVSFLTENRLNPQDLGGRGRKTASSRPCGETVSKKYTPGLLGTGQRQELTLLKENRNHLKGKRFSSCAKAAQRAHSPPASVSKRPTGQMLRSPALRSALLEKRCTLGR